MLYLRGETVLGRRWASCSPPAGDVAAVTKPEANGPPLPVWPPPAPGRYLPGVATSPDALPDVIDVLGVGHALVDVLAMVGDDLVERLGLVKGSMRLVDQEEAEALYAALDPVARVSGGSAVNTVAGVASLGGSAACLARVAADALGAVYTEDLLAAGVAYRSRAVSDGVATGRCLVLVTPDGQRTMSTFLGAGALLGPGDVEEDMVDRSRAVVLEGYLWDSPSATEALAAVMGRAHGGGTTVAMSLSDSFCVERHRKEFLELVSGPPDTGVDLVFANEDEIRLLWGSGDFASAVEATRATGRTAALTRGLAGSVIVSGAETVEIPAVAVERVADTTGAGDLYAAGVLYGLTQGLDLERAGRLGSLAAAEVISHLGGRPQTALLPLARAAGLL